MQFFCAHCGQQLEIEDQMAGAQVICPTCSNEITAPSHGTDPVTPIPQAHVAPAPVPGARTGVEVKTSFFPMAFLLFFCTPNISIDGQVFRKYWGRYFFELPPGQHTIEICFRYCFLSQCGLNTMTINLAPGDVAKISYWMPPWIFAKGSMKAVGDSSGAGVGSVVEPSTTNSKLAIWSLVLGILGFAGLAVLTTIPAIICGHLAYSKIKKSDGALTGKGMALSGLILAYLVLALLLIIAVPSFIHARNLATNNACFNNLRMIDAGKEMWALSENKQNKDEVNIQEVNQYIKGSATPICPKGGKYSYNLIGEDPECSIHGSSSSASSYRRH